MVINLKFSKFDDTPWGFRLIGGTDFDTPLTVVKVRIKDSKNVVSSDISISEKNILKKLFVT